MNLPCISTLIGRDIDAQDEMEAAIDDMADLFFDEWADQEDVPKNLRDDDEFRQDGLNPLDSGATFWSEYHSIDK